VDNASKHINRTQQRLHDEKALLSATMFVIEDDIARSERSEAMLAGLRHTQAVKSVLQVRSVIAAESETRKSEDVELLDTICETQTFLQKTVNIDFLRNAICLTYYLDSGALWQRQCRRGDFIPCS
jgi:hypothetical protein